MRVWVALEFDDPVAAALIAGGYAVLDPHASHGKPEPSAPTLAELDQYAGEHGVDRATAKRMLSDERRGGD